MSEKLRERAVEFVVVTVLLGGILYAATTAYRNSTRLQTVQSEWTKKSKELDTKFSNLRANAEKDSKLQKQALLLVMIRSGVPIEEMQKLFGSADNLRELMEMLEGRPPRRVGSDLRLKTGVRQIENAVSKVIKIDGIQFEWAAHAEASPTVTKSMKVGVIAQQVEGVFPELVSINEAGYLAVDYSGLVALLIEAIKEQQAELDELQSRFDGAR